LSQLTRDRRCRLCTSFDTARNCAHDRETDYHCADDDEERNRDILGALGNHEIRIERRCANHRCSSKRGWNTDNHCAALSTASCLRRSRSSLFRSRLCILDGLPE
jgi:hypothetical protein